MSKKFITILLVSLIVLCLTGCNNQMSIQNTTVKEIIPVFVEYASLHGYKISYRNDETGAFRVELGEVYIPQRMESVGTRATIATSNLNTSVPLTSYEENTWKMVNSDSRYVNVAVMVRIKQKNNNVVIMLDSDNAYSPTSSQGFNLKKYLEDSGYTVEFI